MTKPLEVNHQHHLVESVVCPHCWEPFAPENVLFISEHEAFRGDPRLGPDAQMRFLPTRFNSKCQALDPMGMVCLDMACPRCHLAIPQALLEAKCRFLSVLGAPASGKSYFLGSMIWQTRKVLLQDFGYSFGDAHPEFNKVVNSYEEALFLNPRRDKEIPVGELIPKTQFTGNLLYDQVNLGDQTLQLPKPFLFEYKIPNPGRDPRTRLLCLYDNAGESFLAGSEDANAREVTKHLAQSSALFFVFDPLQDPRFVDALKEADPSISRESFPEISHRQETILREASTRIRRYLSLGADVRHKNPLVVVVGKYDIWWNLLPEAKQTEWIRHSRREGHSDGNDPGISLAAIQRISDQLRDLLARLCPELVGTADFFSETVLFLPVSALGQTPKIRQGGDNNHNRPTSMIRPKDIKPFWVELPLIWFLTKLRSHKEKHQRVS